MAMWEKPLVVRGPGPLVLWRALEISLGLGRVGLSRGVVTPSAYEGGVSLRMAMPAAPQLESARLLQRPSRLRNWSPGAKGWQVADPCPDPGPEYPLTELVERMSSPSTHWDLRPERTLTKKQVREAPIKEKQFKFGHCQNRLDLPCFFGDLCRIFFLAYF